MATGAYEYALNLLSARAYTVRNLRRKLVQKKFGGDEIIAAVERLVAARLLDDFKYAHEFTRQRLVGGNSSVRRVQQDLVMRGIGAEEIRAAIADVMEDEPVDLSRSIDAVATKKISAMGNLADDARRRRLFAFLARRGFEIADIRRIVEVKLPRR